MTVTTITAPLPPQARAFLASLRRSLWSLPAADRRETIAGVETHLEDSLESGRAAAEVLVELGTASEIAARATEEFEARTGRVATPRFLNPARILQLLAFAYCAAVGAYQLVWVQSIVAGDPAGDAVSSFHRFLHGQLDWYWLLPGTLPGLVALVALLLVGRAWRPGILVAVVLLLAASASGLGQGLDAFLGTFLLWLPAVVLEAVALVVPYRARVAR